MAVNFDKEKAYSNIVKKLIEKLPKEADKKFVSDNINVITKNLVIFSDYVRKILDISVEKIPLSSKIKKVTETKIFNSNLKLDEAREIINKLYQEFNNKFQIGGSPEEYNIDKEKPYYIDTEKKKFEEKGYNKFGEGDDIKDLGESDEERVKNWWDDLGFTLFNEYFSESPKTEKYLKFILSEKKYNMRLFINNLCNKETLNNDNPVCKVKDIKNSVEMLFKEDINKDAANKQVVLQEYTEEIRKNLAKIINNLISNENTYLRKLNNSASTDKLDELPGNLDKNKNLLRYVKENQSTNIKEKRLQYEDEIKLLEVKKKDIYTNLGKDPKFFDVRINDLDQSIKILTEILEITDKDDNIFGNLYGEQSEDYEDDEDDEDDFDIEHDIDASEKERGVDDLNTILEVLEKELEGFDRKGLAADQIKKLLEKERIKASDKAFKQVATKTLKDPVTNELNQKLEIIKKNNPQCKLPQYAINPIKIAALKKMRQNVDASVGFCFSNMTLLATKLFSSFPKYSSLILSKWFHDLSKLYNFDWHDFADFSRKLDWVYLYLFIMSSVPFIGFWSDLLIIVRAIKEGRGFLSILTFVTSFISMFTFHMIDVGMIIKLLYFLDTTSYNSAKYEGEKPNMVDSDVVFSRGSVDFNVAKDFITGSRKKKSQKEEKSFFSVLEDTMKSAIEKKGINSDIDDEDDAQGIIGDEKIPRKGIKRQITGKEICDKIKAKLIQIKNYGKLNIDEDEIFEIINKTQCNYKEALKQIMKKVSEEEHTEDDDGDDDYDDDTISTSKEEYVRKGDEDIKPDGKVRKKISSHADEELTISSFRRNPTVDEEEDNDIIMEDEHGNSVGKYGELPDSNTQNIIPHLWHNCQRFLRKDLSKRKLNDYCHFCWDPIIEKPIGGKNPKKDFEIIDNEIIETWNHSDNTNFRVEQHADWKYHHSLLVKFMNNKNNLTRTKSLEEIKDMLKEPKQVESIVEDIIDHEEPAETSVVTKKPKSKIQPDIKPTTGIFGKFTQMGQFGNAGQPIIVDDDTPISLENLTEPESGLGYKQDFSKEHQEIEKFRPCDQAGVDCSQSVHGIAYKPNYKTKLCEKVKLVSKDNLFGPSLTREKSPDAKEYTVIGRDKGSARKKCQKDLNESITIDLTKDASNIDKSDIKRITKYLGDLREKYSKIVNDKKAVITDWNRNKSQLDKIVTNAKHGIKPTGTYDIDIGVHKCIPYTYTNSRDGFKKGNCVWAPSGKKAIGDNITMNWKPEGKLYKKGEKDACQKACVDTLNKASDQNLQRNPLKKSEEKIQELLQNGEIDDIMQMINENESEFQ